MFVKEIRGILYPAPATLTVDGRVHYHPPDELYLAQGYTYIVDTPYPGTGDTTDPEYDDIYMEKVMLTDAVYSGEITIDEVPDEWKTEIKHNVDYRRAMEACARASEADFISALSELGVTVSEES